MDPVYQAPVPPPPGEMIGSPVQPPAKKSKALIIILIVIAVLLLCCCGCGTAVYFLDVIPDDLFEVPVAAPNSPVAPVDPAPNAPNTDDHLAAWDSFSPTLTEMAGPADTRQERIAREVFVTRIPGFEVVEVLVDPGGMDEDGSFIVDSYFVLLRSLRDPSVELAYDFSAETQEGFDAEAEWVVEDLESNEELAYLSDGTEYVFWTDVFPELQEGTADDDYHRLLAQIAADWPGSVNTWVDYYEDGDYVEAWAYPTTWEQFADTRYFEGFEGYYELIDGAWIMTSWDTWEIEPE